MNQLKINNRRFIGSKASISNFILKEIDSIVKKEGWQKNKVVVGDLFAGTGIISQNLLLEGYNVIINDFLYSNYVPYQAWLSKGKYSKEKISKLISFYNYDFQENIIEKNYVSKHFGGKYFSIEDAKVIGAIREDIEKKKNQLTQREYFILLSALMYEVDRIANTVGHFEHYLSEKPEIKGIKLRDLKIEKNKGTSEIYCEDVNELAPKLSGLDIVYLDPPYNARQYVNFYHVLENLMRWEKPLEFEGKSMKFKRDHLKSEYSRAKAPVVFQDLIMNLDAKYILVSYNNTYNARSSASNNKISEEEMVSILRKKGSLRILEKPYPSFNAGKTNFKNHKEILYICEVSK